MARVSKRVRFALHCVQAICVVAFLVSLSVTSRLSEDFTRRPTTPVPSRNWTVPFNNHAVYHYITADENWLFEWIFGLGGCAFLVAAFVTLRLDPRWDE
jgi:hypothetical protein